MYILVDKYTNFKVDIGDKEPTPELIESLRKKFKLDRIYIAPEDQGLAPISIGSSARKERSSKKSKADNGSPKKNVYFYKNVKVTYFKSKTKFIYRATLKDGDKEIELEFISKKGMAKAIDEILNKQEDD